MGVRVDQVGDLAGPAVGPGDVVDGAQQVVADGRRGVDQDDAAPGAKEHRLVAGVGDPVQVAGDLTNVVTIGVQGRAERGGRDRRVVGQGLPVQPRRGAAFGVLLVDGLAIFAAGDDRRVTEPDVSPAD
jgi:hypothetical protein